MSNITKLVSGKSFEEIKNLANEYKLEMKLLYFYSFFFYFIISSSISNLE
jgi:hypothetical protein